MSCHPFLPLTNLYAQAHLSFFSITSHASHRARELQLYKHLYLCFGLLSLSRSPTTDSLSIMSWYFNIFIYHNYKNWESSCANWMLRLHLALDHGQLCVLFHQHLLSFRLHLGLSFQSSKFSSLPWKELFSKIRQTTKLSHSFCTVIFLWIKWRRKST